MTEKGKPDKRILAAIVMIHAAIAALTWRDLRTRAADEVRGDKRIWRIASVLNTLGSAAYWLFGRLSREPAAPTADAINPRSRNER